MCLVFQAKQKQRSIERAERMSRLKEVAIGQHTEDDVRTAVAKLTEVQQAAAAVAAAVSSLSPPDDRGKNSTASPEKDPLGGLRTRDTHSQC